MIETGHEILPQTQPVGTQADRKALTRKKSAKLMRARFLEQSGELEEAEALYLEVAQLEEKISEQLMAEGRQDKATINLVSAASCWKTAGHYDRALEILADVLQSPSIPSSFRQEINGLKEEWEWEVVPVITDISPIHELVVSTRSIPGFEMPESYEIHKTHEAIVIIDRE